MEKHLEGIITKGIGGFYYVENDGIIYECKARGKIKQEGITPVVGDRVVFDINNQGYGSIEKVLERKNYLVRPMVANIDQAIIVQAMTNPEPNLVLLDRMILFAESQHLDIVICFNKSDLVGEDFERDLLNIYKSIGYKALATSIETKSNIETIHLLLKGKVNVFAGPSGVGKSSLLNYLDDTLNLQTGEVSKKIGRGKHTTRHAELLKLSNGGWVVDTPGFSSLELLPVDDAARLADYFIEFHPFIGQCRFNGCRHDKEPDCKIKYGVETGKISKSRYDSYIIFLYELLNRRKY